MKKAVSHQDLKELLRQGDRGRVASLCLALHPADLAEQIENLEPDDGAALVSVLDVDCGAEVVSHLDESVRPEIVARLEEPVLAGLISRMPHDERADLVRSMPSDRAEVVLRKVAIAEREDILRLSSYPEGTAGAVMTSDYARLSPTMTAREALGNLRLEAPDKETIYYSYVIDQARRLLGLVSLKDLILARPDSRIESIMARDLVTARVDEPQEETARKLAKYDLIAIPVVDAMDALVGIVTFDDALDVTQEEATQDFHLMAPISSHISAGVGEAGVWTMARKRAPWLLVLIFVNIFSGAGIAHYEATIEQVVALVFFLPLLIASGGNAGSQSTTLMIRGLATGEVAARDWRRLLGREVIVAVALGVTMGLAVSMVGVYRGGAPVAVVVALSMVACVLVGSIIGLCLPFLLTRLGLDPATASSPLVTSLADIAGVLIYLGIATWYLGIG